MWYLLATSLAALSLNKSLAYLLLGLTAFLGWKQSILDAPALLLLHQSLLAGLLLNGYGIKIINIHIWSKACAWPSPLRWFYM